MNEADIFRNDIDNNPVGSGQIRPGDGVRVRTLESALDELAKMLLVPAMTFAIVMLRGWYQGKKRWPARIVEATLFAVIARVMMPAATELYMQIWHISPQSAYDYAFMTCIIAGFIGVDTLSDAAKNYFGGKR
ncbi:MAG: phage holin family protein [Rhodoferax sp.]|nr:phage holin family protein [Rhodoferax sp.]